jgi:hypothetical protein
MADAASCWQSRPTGCAAEPLLHERCLRALGRVVRCRPPRRCPLRAAQAKDSPRPKWGYVSTRPGSRLHINVSTVASSSGTSKAEVMVELSYLKSYEGMGVANVSERGRGAPLGGSAAWPPWPRSGLQSPSRSPSTARCTRAPAQRRPPPAAAAQVTCEGGCTCTPSQLNGHHGLHNSQLFLHSFAVSQSPACTIAVLVVEETSGGSGAHKVKVTGIIISEQAGSTHLIHNAAAVDYVSDIAARDQEQGGKFNVLNHAR